MRDFFEWILANQEIIKAVLGFALSLGSFVYAFVIHSKSKKRLTELELKEEAKSDLIKSLQELKEAYERSIKNGK